MIRIIIKFIRIYILWGSLILFFSCFGRQLKINAPSGLHEINAKLHSIVNWIENNENDINDLKKLVKEEISLYLFTNLKIHQNIIENIDIMEESIGDVVALRKDISSKVEILQQSNGNSLQSLMNEENSNENEIGLLFNDIKNEQEEFYKGKKGIIEAFKIDRRKLIFIRDETSSYKKEFNHLRYEQYKLENAFQKHNVGLSKTIFNNGSSKKEMLELSIKIEDYRLELSKIEFFIIHSERIAREETGSWVCLRPMTSLKNGQFSKAIPMDFEKKYKSGIRDYKTILRDMRIELNSI